MEFFREISPQHKGRLLPGRGEPAVFAELDSQCAGTLLEGRVARWTLDLGRWECFREQSLGWDQRPGEPPNNADLSQIPGPSGIEIVVTGEAILIGEDFHPLEKNVVIQSYGEWMEFDQMIDNQNGPNLHLILRIPLAPGGHGESAKIEQVYREAFGEAADNSKFKIYAALIIFVGLPALTGFIVLVVHLVKRFGLN